MSQTTTAPKLATETKPAARGFAKLTCLFCSEDGGITLDLDDMTGEKAFSCRHCDTQFSLAEVEAKLAAWAPVAAWVRTAPELPASE